MRTVPVVVVAALDPVLRDALTFAMTCDLPRVVTVRHDLTTTELTGTMRRVVYDAADVVEDETVTAEHDCVCCAHRADVTATVDRLARARRWKRIVVALPSAVDPTVIASHIGELETADVAATVAVVDAATLTAELFGDDLLAERRLALDASDRRSVGEALARHLDVADVVAAVHLPRRTSHARELLSHLAGQRLAAAPGVESVDVATLFERTHDPLACARRLDPRRVLPNVTAPGDGGGAWTADLHSDRPFHPARLLENLSQLAVGRLRGRGRFWLPTRPATVCAWDGAGGQLSIGSFGDWRNTKPSTRLVITGIDDVEAEVREAFEASLLTDEELALDSTYWQSYDDGFTDWLGAQYDHA